MIGQEKAAQVQLSTLHALGFRTLRYFWEDYIALHPRREAYPFTIIDDEVACRFIKKCLLMKGDTEEVRVCGHAIHDLYAWDLRNRERYSSSSSN
jgi:hypothetical protein